MNRACVISVMLSFAISVLLGPVVIPLLRKLKAGQTVRDDGPQTHLKKTGTPTMGGILILVSIAAVSLLFLKDYPHMAPVLFLTFGFGLVGFLSMFAAFALLRGLWLLLRRALKKRKTNY